MEYKRAVSADGHINEPPDMFVGLPQQLKDVTPYVIRQDSGDDAWIMYPGAPPRPISTSAQAGRKYEDYLKEPTNFENMRPGSFDPKARIDDMELDGIDAEVLYPGIVRGIGTVRPEVRKLCSQAYNDWLIQFCSYDPDRLVGLAVAALDDGADFVAQEMKRVRKLGLRSLNLYQSIDGMPVNDPGAEPVWAASVELDMPINLHIGTSALVGAAPTARTRLPGTAEAGLCNFDHGVRMDVTAMVFAGVFDRHPNLKVVAAEGGIGFAPFLIDRMEDRYDRHRHRLNSPLKRRPREYMQKNVFYTFQEDHPGVTLRHDIGINQIMWASDYPHTDTTWPRSQEVMEEHFGKIPADERYKIVAGNAVALYGLA